MTEELLGWWWCDGSGKLPNGDGRAIVVGETLTVEGEIIVCRRGLHASRRALDALRYAPGAVVCRVRLSGTIREQSNKAAAAKRTVLAMADATKTLHEFACLCAEQGLLLEREQGREPDPRCWAAIGAKRQWLHGEITDRQLAAARAAAWAAAWAAATDAAHAATAAASDAATAAATDAAWDAAKAAARAASVTARAAAWDAQNAELEKRLHELLGTTPEAQDD